MWRVKEYCCISGYYFCDFNNRVCSNIIFFYKWQIRWSERVESCKCIFFQSFFPWFSENPSNCAQRGACTFWLNLKEVRRSWTLSITYFDEAGVQHLSLQRQMSRPIQRLGRSWTFCKLIDPNLKNSHSNCKQSKTLLLYNSINRCQFTWDTISKYTFN